MGKSFQSKPLMLASCVLTVSLIAFSAAPAISQTPSFLTSWSSGGIPLGLAQGASGEIYMADEDVTVALRVFSPSGNLQAIWGNGQGFEGYGVVRLLDGSVLVANYYACRVLRFSSDGTLVESWPTGGSLAIYLALDAAQDVYVTDGDGNRIRKFTAHGAPLGDWPSPHPTGIVCASGSVYAVGPTNGLVSRYSLDGAPLGTYSSGATTPEQLTVDNSGNFYLADYGSNTLRCYTPDWAPIWTIGPTVAGYSYGSPKFHSVLVAQDGTIFAGDFTNRRVLHFAPLPTAVAKGTWGQLKARYR